MNAIINFASNLIHGVSSNKDVFKFNGGVHPHDHKAESTTLPIAQLAMPEKLILPLRQHVGHIPKILVQVGDFVLKGQMLAEPEGALSAAIHAPTSGTITAISEQVIPHPSGLPDMCIMLAPDGKDTWAQLQPLDWRNTDKKVLVDSLRSSGIVGLGGATFPTHIKLRTNGKSNVHTLVINAAECEPYITCDDMLMRERAEQIIKGIEIVQSLLGAEKCMIGIEDNKPQAASAMSVACANKAMQVKVVPTLYPSGDARRLIHLLLDVEIPNDKRSTDVGIQVFNIATLLAVYRYFEFGEPSINRIVTMTGNVVKPQNFEVLFGTPLQSLIAAAGGAKVDTTHYIMGGPMMGFDLPNEQVPITKAANCIIAAAPNLFAAPPPAMPCIRCARCADACPVNLQPQELYWFSKADNFEKARDYNLFDCIECGCCTYVCPSDIPLVQYYRYAKSEIIALDKAKEAADLARERNDFRLARIEREKLERAQKHAERAQAGKAEAKSTETSSAETTKEKPSENQEAMPNTEANTTAATDKQAAIAAAIARAKAQKLASANAAESPKENVAATETTKTPEAEAAELKAKQDKQALIAAAIERAKAQKLAAAQAGVAPKNVENVSAAVQAEINQTEAIREKVNLATETKKPE
ncbi:electron transport complex subunit RsxC [Methylotenera sp.]|uniref:electron transport complex subunit RsxC n=1 Tax=Methylotenera sp. TaxID=2051956 RepID=UPI002488E68B|nr:electron transport complex subunit RsxC [Methylotenera sp.]MDI1299173.1 electron transport complex subunit RsxC [Methylotenera sp.]